ncbi:hypothetical protein Pelo_18101 [Pelomyxa schiedti]|nr:hypothetical protein Pelo_18101 [Pelomyxa schiedti]
MYVGVVAVFSSVKMRNPDPRSMETRHSVSGLRISARTGRIVEKEEGIVLWTSGHEAPRSGDALAIVSSFRNAKDVLVVKQYDTIDLNIWEILERRGEDLAKVTVDHVVPPIPIDSITEKEENLIGQVKVATILCSSGTDKITTLCAHSEASSVDKQPPARVIKKNVPTKNGTASTSTCTSSSTAAVAGASNRPNNQKKHHQQQRKPQPQRGTSTTSYPDRTDVPRYSGSKRPLPFSPHSLIAEDQALSCCTNVTATTYSSLDTSHTKGEEYLNKQAAELDAILEELLGPADLTSTPRKQHQSTALQVLPLDPPPMPSPNNLVGDVQPQGVDVNLDLGSLEKCLSGSISVSLLNICSVSTNQFLGVDLNNREAMVTMDQDFKFVEGCVYRVTIQSSTKMEPDAVLDFKAVAAAPHPGAAVRACYQYTRPIGNRWLAYTPTPGKELKRIHDVCADTSERNTHSCQRKDFVGRVTGSDHGNTFYLLFEDGTHKKVFFSSKALQALQFRTNTDLQRLDIGKVIACKNAAIGYKKKSIANHEGYVALIDAMSIVIPLKPDDPVAQNLRSMPIGPLDP